VALATDDEREVRSQRCATCERTFDQVTAFVHRDGDAYAIYYAQCHGHGDAPEVWLDLVVGTWEEPDFPDQVSFSCRVTADGAGLVDALAVVEGRAEFFGRKLSRADALNHDRLPEVWKLVDHIVTSDTTVASYIYGEG